MDVTIESNGTGKAKFNLQGQFLSVKLKTDIIEAAEAGAEVILVRPQLDCEKKKTAVAAKPKIRTYGDRMQSFFASPKSGDGGVVGSRKRAAATLAATDCKKLRTANAEKALGDLWFLVTDCVDKQTGAVAVGYESTIKVRGQ